MTDASEFWEGVRRYKAEHPDEDIEFSYHGGQSVWPLVVFALGMGALLIVVLVLQTLGFLPSDL